jgi:hypothetical protein
MNCPDSILTCPTVRWFMCVRGPSTIPDEDDAEELAAVDEDDNDPEAALVAAALLADPLDADDVADVAVEESAELELPDSPVDDPPPLLLDALDVVASMVDDEVPPIDMPPPVLLVSDTSDLGVQ